MDPREGVRWLNFPEGFAPPLKDVDVFYGWPLGIDDSEKSAISYYVDD